MSVGEEPQGGDNFPGVLLLKYISLRLAALKEKDGSESQDGCVPGSLASAVVSCMASPVCDLALPLGVYGTLPSLCSAPVSPADVWMAALWGHGQGKVTSSPMWLPRQQPASLVGSFCRQQWAGL